MTTISESREMPRAPWLEGIEGEQARELIESDDQVIRVIAGPGSGKTTCLKRRVQRLIQKDGLDQKGMFVGTFTRAISGELREALGTDVHVSTLHALAYELLRKYPTARQGMRLRFLLKYEEDVLLYDLEDDAAPVGDIYKRREALRMLQASRSQRTEYANARFDGAIRRWLQSHRAMLIGEVVHLCVVGLESLDIPRGMFDHVVIDEYQDLTAAEQELVRLIWSRNGALTVLGDDDQSIYGFRFNHPRGLAEFARDWPQCKDLTFSENRRSGAHILNAANLMMAEAGSSKPPMKLQTTQAGELRVVTWESLDDEVSGLAQYIRAHPDESFLVLVPRRFIGHKLAEAIGPDAKTAFAEETLEHPIAQESFITASLLADPEDFVAVRAYLGLHGSKREHAPRRNADAYSCLPLDIGGHVLIRRIANDQVRVTGTGRGHIIRRAKRAAELIDRSLSPTEVIDLVFDEGLAEEEQEDEKRRWLADDLRDLRGAARELLSRQKTSSMSEIVATLRYRIATRAPLRTSELNEPRVRIMTLHSAKGLEADNVVIAGIADQFMPGKEGRDTDVVAEQRRLLYVAVTRARDRLLISWSRRIPTVDLVKNMGRIDDVFTMDDIKWARTSRSPLLPQGLSGVISGDQFLASIEGQPL